MDLNALRDIVNSQPVLTSNKESVLPMTLIDLENEVRRRVSQLTPEEIGDGVNENSIRQLLLLRQHN